MLWVALFPFCPTLGPQQVRSGLGAIGRVGWEGMCRQDGHQRHSYFPELYDGKKFLSLLLPPITRVNVAFSIQS